ncbi:unnamed protein product [Echinostoma caproni]|uniref:Uncharacterized protein n=1 Tax=Echinostoma caproni TaxID=27848 RepID=A0A3P8L9D3_9TREM|nr:unnamed protein product [Echinostoma caproni]
MVAFLHERELEARRKEEETGRHAKPYKPHSASGARKLSRVEKIQQRGAQAVSRRGKESKRGTSASYANREFGFYGKADEENCASSGPASEKSQRDSMGNRASHSTALDEDEFPSMQGSQPSTVQQPMGPWSDRVSAWGSTSGGSGKDRSKTEHSTTTGGSSSKPASSSPHASKPSTPTTIMDSSSGEPESERETKNITNKPIVSKEGKKHPHHHHPTNRGHSDTVHSPSTQAGDHGSSDYGASQPVRDSVGYRGRRAGFYGSRASSGYVSAPRRPGKPSHRGRRDSDSSLHGYAGDVADSPRDTSAERGPAHVRPQSVRARRGSGAAGVGGSNASGGSTRGAHNNDGDASYHRGSHRLIVDDSDIATVKTRRFNLNDSKDPHAKQLDEIGKLTM